VYAALRSGVITEWRATLIVRETACLSLTDRQQVDKELVGQLGGLSDRATAQAAARIGQRLDPEQYVKRAAKATQDRRVSCRPAPDTMTYVTALLPVAWGVAVYAALTKQAATATATGDPRSRGQLMADEFVHRITTPHAGAIPANPANPAKTGTPEGRTAAQQPRAADVKDHTRTPDTGTGVNTRPAQAGSDTRTASSSTGTRSVGAATCGSHPSTAGADPSTAGAEDGSAGLGVIPPGVNLDIQLVMTDRTLFDGDDEPAVLTGYGPIPAPLARRLIRDAAPTIKTWVRRLYTDPGTGQLIDADTRRRTFSHAARQFLTARDHTCRGPFCDAPIRHADHVVSHQQGGPTRTSNGQGLCERCNHTKEQPGWSSRVDPDGITITITTPTGHTIRTTPPPPPRSTPWAEDRPIEYRPREHRRPDGHQPDGHPAGRHLPGTPTPLERRLARLIGAA
jgi:hypothetical protein